MLQELPMPHPTDLSIFPPQKTAVHKIKQWHICTLHNTYIMCENNVFRKYWMTKLLSHQIFPSQLLMHTEVPSIALTLDKQTSQWSGSEQSSLNMSTSTCPILAVLLFKGSTHTPVAVPQWAPLNLQPQQCCCHGAMGWCRGVPVHVGWKL